MMHVFTKRYQTRGLEVISFHDLGFTLIELLVVIAVLGVLAVVVLIAINPVQKLAQARDAGRKSGLTQIQTALESYGVSHNGTYPNTSSGCTDNGGYCTSALHNWTAFTTILIQSGDLKTSPVDPVNNHNVGLEYQYVPQCLDGNGNFTSYVLFALLENNSDPSGMTTPINVGCGTWGPAWILPPGGPYFALTPFFSPQGKK